MPSVNGSPALFPPALKSLSIELYFRLRLVPEFCGHIAIPSDTAVSTSENAQGEIVRSLWSCFVRGEPLHVLLDLLGSRNSTSASLLSLSSLRDDTATPSQEDLITEFLKRIEVLEAQSIVTYGESFRVNDLTDGSTSGFLKVLMTIKRITSSLEATHPDLYELPDDLEEKQRDSFARFYSQELQYSKTLKNMSSDVAHLCSILSPLPHSLECLVAYLTRIFVYHDHITRCIEASPSDSITAIDWNEVFAWQNSDLQVAGTGAYRSYCTEYPKIVYSLDELRRKSSMHEGMFQRCSELSKRVRSPIEHILGYQQTLSAMLSILHPVHNRPTFDALCTAFLKFSALSSTILEVARCIRTGHALYCINKRAFFWNGPDPATLGELLLDDCIFIGVQHPGSTSDALLFPASEIDSSDACFVAFVFEEALLLCKPPHCSDSEELSVGILRRLSDITCRYPIERWDLGPALRSEGSLSVFCAIPTNDIWRIYRPEIGELSFDIVWKHGDSSSTVTVNCSEEAQLEQWIRVMRAVSPADALSISLDTNGGSSYVLFSDIDDLLSREESSHQRLSRLRSKAKPWSLIARKEGTPPSSLYHLSNGSGASFSPIVSPKFTAFITDNPISPRSFSPLRHSRTTTAISIDIETIEEIAGCIDELAIENKTSKCVLDLTGQILKLENYPAAHGGFADVWKCAWVVGSERHMVAVKVLRGRLSSRDQEEKMSRVRYRTFLATENTPANDCENLVKRLHRELRVWQRLEHENVIPLFGTCDDFGHYASLVCPWFENGSLQRFLVRNAGELQLADRLKLLSEIASGLSYLHSFSIVHGDLSSSNVLISDQRKACLCDFGLATVIEELKDLTNSSVLGGAVRWAAPELYDIPECNQTLPRPSTSSDIYSYGSLALEVLSGNVPYHYLKNEGQVLLELHKKVKPDRPKSTFVTDELWGFIGQCWNDRPDARPSSLDVSSKIQHYQQRAWARHSI